MDKNLAIYEIDEHIYICNLRKYLGIYSFAPTVNSAEMPTLIVAHQEYERHFSGIWGHFQEYQIFQQ